MIFDIFYSSKKNMDSSDVKEISDEMNGNNSDTSIQSADDMDDLDNLPHNLARFARSSYSRKVGRINNEHARQCLTYTIRICQLR